MNSAPSPVYCFGPFRLDTQERHLVRDGQVIPLTPKAFDLLVTLARRSGQIVEKEELLKEVWPGAFVEESNLTVHMSALRKALGEGPDEAVFIETLPRRGYRFCVPVEVSLPQPRTLVIERHKETRIVREEFEEEVASRLRISKRAMVVAALALLVAAAGFAGWRFARSAEARPIAPLRVHTFASYSSGISMPAFAPDGERIAFGWIGPDNKNWDIYVKNIGNDPPLRLTTYERADLFPAWSPDGRQIAFLRDMPEGKSALYVIGALGGAERELLDLPASRYYDLAWSGRYIAYARKVDPGISWGDFRSLTIFLLDMETHAEKQVTFPDKASGDDRFAFSPDGQTLAFVRHHDLGTLTASSIWLLPMNGGPARKVYEERNWIGYLDWAGDGDSLVFTSTREGGSKLYRVAATGGVADPLPFAEDEVSFPAVSRQGQRLAYIRHYFDSDLLRVELKDARGNAASSSPFLRTQRSEGSAEFSPDGRHVAFISESTGRSEVWLAKADGTGMAALTDFCIQVTSTPRWSPDGKEAAFSCSSGPAKSEGGAFAIDMETREVRRLTDEGFFSPSWSHDGRWIYLTSAQQREDYEIWRMPAQGGPPVQITKNGGLGAQESWDGKTLFFNKREGGIWKVPVNGGEEKQVLVHPAGGYRSYWKVASEGIYYLKTDTRAGGSVPPREIHFFEIAGGRSRRIAVLAGEPPYYSGSLAVSPDGKSIIYSQVARTGDDIMLVENFR